MSQKNINRLASKLGFLAWGLSCVGTNFLIDRHDALRSFQEQTRVVKFGAFLGLSAFLVAMVFSGYLLLISARSSSIQPALELLPWSSKNGGPSAAAFRTACGASAPQSSYFFLSCSCESSLDEGEAPPSSGGAAVKFVSATTRMDGPVGAWSPSMMDATVCMPGMPMRYYAPSVCRMRS